MKDAPRKTTPQGSLEAVERKALEDFKAKRGKKKQRPRPTAAPKAAVAPKPDDDGPKLPLMSLNEPAPASAPRNPDPAVVGAIRQSIPRNPQGLEVALEAMGLELRYNLRGATPEWRGGAVSSGRTRADLWSAANDRVDSFIREGIAETFVTGSKGQPAKFGAETWSDSVNALCYLAEVDPFLDWLLDLPEWDGTERLGCWLEDVFTVERSPLTTWVSRFLLLGPVARAFQPGRKLDESPVLAGPQACGKSTALRMLLPEDQPDWFADGLHLAAEEKKRAEALLGRVIVEASEMAGSNRADLESLKAFLTRTDDGSVRLAYRRNPERMLRRCIIVGTTNSSESLPNDVTGNRRFVVVDVEAGPDGVDGLRRYLDTNRAQLWAEALAVHKDGSDPIRLPEELAPAQAEANERHRRSDTIIEDAVASLIPRTDARLQELMVAASVVSPNATPDRRTELRFAAALRLGGWTRFRTRKGPRWSKGDVSD